VYIAVISKGNRNKSGAKIKINITAITDPKINPNQSTKPPTSNAVTIIFHNNRNGNNKIFSINF
jgi:hypothetical protein